MSIIELTFTIEILFFNILLFDRCCKRKYSYWITIGVVLVFSCVFLASFYELRLLFFPGEAGNGTFALLGFFYLIPLYFLYQENIARIFVVMCMTWSYTFSILALSVQIAKLLPDENFKISALIIETGIFLLSMVPFYRLALPKYVFILQNIYKFAPHWGVYLGLNSAVYFVSMAVLNFIFIGDEGSLMKVLVIWLLILFAFVSYTTIYQMVYGLARIKEIEYEAEHDALTGVANRARLFSDLEDLIKEEKIFSILFMDLDHFKLINDKFGHMMGDQYLKHFAKVCSSMFEGRGTMYRFGGDEFVVLYPGQVTQQEIEQIRRCDLWEEGAPCQFFQVSVGFLHCRPPHKSAEKILQQVDQEMYRQKVKQNRQLFG